MGVTRPISSGSTSLVYWHLRADRVIWEGQTRFHFGTGLKGKMRRSVWNPLRSLNIPLYSAGDWRNSSPFSPFIFLYFFISLRLSFIFLPWHAEGPWRKFETFCLFLSFKPPSSFFLLLVIFHLVLLFLFRSLSFCLPVLHSACYFLVQAIKKTFFFFAPIPCPILSHHFMPVFIPSFSFHFNLFS